MPLLQVISTCPKDSLTIQNAGADRIELVSALQIGGLTPSSAIIRKSLQCVDIPTMVMIRHHNNGFLHSQEEIELFCQEINQCKQMGVKGIVFGGLTKNNEIDTNLIQKVQNQIGQNKIDFTFHKAFDQSNNIVASYQFLSKLGVNRVLTQGGMNPIMENLSILSQIVQKSKKQNTTKVLLGGGITFNNVGQIVKNTKAEEVHIGTCVRKNKYGPVLGQKVQQFIENMKG